MKIFKNLRMRFNTKVYITHPFYFGMTGFLQRRLLGLVYQVVLEQRGESGGIKFTSHHKRWFLWLWVNKVDK